jgi:signal transduction histidine kinase
MGVDWGRFSSPKKRFYMKNNKIFALAAVALVCVALCAVAVAQDQATAQEVVKKVREAASTLSKTSDVAQFNDKEGPWVWKDTYVFIQDCDKKVVAAHPIKPEQIGKDLASVKDAKSGKSAFPEDWCKRVENAPSGAWNEYNWPKPGEKEASRKLAYCLRAKGTPYLACSGVYDDKATIAEVSKLSSGK